MSEPITVFGGVPQGRRLEDAPDRPAGRFGILRVATPELCDTLRRHGVREIPAGQLERHPGGRNWTDLESGEQLELVRSFVDPASPGDAGCIAYAIRDGYLVPFKARGDQGSSTSTHLGVVHSGLATGRERIA